MPLKEYRELEEKNCKKIKEKMTADISNFTQRMEKLLKLSWKELKKYDLLVLVKMKKVTPVLKEIFKSIFKPLIILPNVGEISDWII